MTTAILLASLLAIPAAATDGARSLIVVCHATPAHRAALLHEMETSGARQLQRWKDEGALQGYQLLLSRHLDSRTWDAMAILAVADGARWKKIEHEFPGGLPPAVLALTSEVETVPAALVRHHQESRAQGEPVFLVIPYEVTVPTGEYLAYLDDYVVPQLNGWTAEGILAGHALYLASYPAGRPWQSLLVLEYRGDGALAARESVVAKVRARLSANARWKAVSENKKSVRVERAPAVADPVSWRSSP